MNNAKWVKLTILAGVATLAMGGAAQAQDFIYFLSPQSQIDAQQYTSYYANMAANSWMSYAQQMRANGYTGQLTCPTANTQTLMQSNQALQQTYSSMNNGYFANQQTNSGAMDNYSQVQRGEYPVSDPSSGQQYYTNGSGNYQWANPYTGQTAQTDSYGPPDYQSYWNQLQYPSDY